MGERVRWQGSRLEPLEGRINLEGLGERHARLGAELVVVEAAHTATEGEKGQVQRACLLWGPEAWAGGFDGRTADLSSVRVVLAFRASAIAMPASGPRRLSSRLRTRRRQVIRANVRSV